MPRLIIHIGLPKTATTSLQLDLFPFLPKKDFTYLGVCQPRKKMIQSDLFLKFMEFIQTGENMLELKMDLENELETGKDVVISDEMMVVSNNTQWITKLKNLKALVHDLNYHLIVTVREPSKALFSYYVERYKIYKNLNKSFYEIALNHESMKIYHYKFFFSYLMEHFDKDLVFVKKFEEIINGQNSDFVSLLNISKDIENAIIKNNNSKNKIDNQIIVNTKISIGNIKLSESRDIKLAHVLNFIKSKIGFKPIINLILKISYKKNEKIDIPNEAEFQSLRKYLKAENQYLGENFKIYY